MADRHFARAYAQSEITAISFFIILYFGFEFYFQKKDSFSLIYEVYKDLRNNIEKIQQKLNKIGQTTLVSKYKTGQKAPVTGKYRCEQCEVAETINELSLTAGNRFPPCNKCKGAKRRAGTIARPL